MHAMYGTGATLWQTNDLTQATSGKATHWTVGANGIEETAVISLLSPPTGAHLFSGLGDIGCFRNDDFAHSPAAGALSNPLLSNCDSLAFAAANPALMVRAGRTWAGAATHGGFSTDSGVTWQVFSAEPAGVSQGGKVLLSANGTLLLWLTRRNGIFLSPDLGQHWTAVQSGGSRPQVVADPVAPERFYVYDPDSARLSRSDGAALEFQPLSVELPHGGRLFSNPQAADDLWLASSTGLWHVDLGAGTPAAPLPGVDAAYALGFGKGAEPGTTTVFLSGKVAGRQGIFRSTGAGQTWTQVDDDQHHYGWIGVLAGDPRVFGRVYLGTNGRGVIVAEPNPASRPGAP